jgi:hypothetical protein
MIKNVIQSCPELAEGKAAAILTRGAYFQYVSMTKWRERCWWLFSSFPEWMQSRFQKNDGIEGKKSYGVS